MRVPILYIVTLALLFACNQPDKKEKGIVDTIKDDKSDSVTRKKRDTALLTLSEEILQAIKSKDYEKVASFISPGAGVRFSPYGFIDTNTSQVLFPSQLIEYAKNKKRLAWGAFDGSGDTITLTVPAYFEKFVYNEDYVNAEKKSVNQFLANGNSLNNLHETFPGADFTEFYFPGFDPKYEGMDWQTLRLIFHYQNNRYVLIGIVHDQWTS